MATLFAANGGALIALLNAGKTSVPGRMYALAWFATGIVMSLLMGAASTHFAFRASLALTKGRLMIEEGLITGAPPAKPDLMGFIEDQKPTWKTWLPTYAGVASLLFFVLGLATVAGSLLRA